MEKETLYRFFRGETTPDEQQCLMDWLDADEEHRRTFDRERQMYNALLLFAPQKQVAFRQAVTVVRYFCFYELKNQQVSQRLFTHNYMPCRIIIILLTNMRKM